MPEPARMPPPTESALQSPDLAASIDLIEVARGLRTLARGARGGAVALVQRALVRVGFLKAADGAYGRGTDRAVARLQRIYGLAPTGRLDAATLLLLDRALLCVDALGALPLHLPAAGPRSQPELLAVLHTAPCHSAAYRGAVAAWPQDQPIYPHLVTRAAREELVRHIVQVDDTNQRSYTSFSNLCTGFAAQLYVRLSDRARLDPDSGRHLLDLARVDPAPAPIKLRVPLFIAINGGHAFSAFLVDPAAPDHLASYLFFEPQTDAFLAPGGPSWYGYVERFGVSLVDLAAFDERGRFDLRSVRDFALSGSGAMIRVSCREVVNLLRDLAIAESTSANYTYYVAPHPSYDHFIRHRASQIWRLDDDGLVETGRLAVGRRFRRSPSAPPELMTPERYAAILGRPDLAPYLT